MDMRKLLCLVLVFALINPGCSAFRSKTQTLTITTDQPDSEIYVNGSLAGRGTAMIPVKRDENVEVMAKKSGYETVHRTVGTHMNTTSILDIIGGVLFIIPIFGLLAGGAKSLDQNNMTIMMVKKEEVPLNQAMRVPAQTESVWTQESSKGNSVTPVGDAQISPVKPAASVSSVEAPLSAVSSSSK